MKNIETLKTIYTVRFDFFDSGEFLSQIGPEEGIDVPPALARSFFASSLRYDLSDAYGGIGGR